MQTLKSDDGKTYHNSYTVGEIPGWEDFMKLNKQEKAMDSLSIRANAQMDSILTKSGNEKMNDSDRKDFLNNRSRAYTNTYKNGMLKKKENTKFEFQIYPCECYVAKDTFYMNTGFSFFGGEGFNIKVFKDSFQSNYYVWTESGSPKTYKSNPNDTAFTDNAIVTNKYQYLVLDKKPDFKPGQQISGYYTYTSHQYYQDEYAAIKPTLDTIHLSGKIYFTCKTKRP